MSIPDEPDDEQIATIIATRTQAIHNAIIKAQENSDAAQERQKRDFDRRRACAPSPKRLKHGDFVMRQPPARQRAKGGMHMSEAYKTAYMVCGFNGSRVKLLAKNGETFYLPNQEVRLVYEKREQGACEASKVERGEEKGEGEGKQCSTGEPQGAAGQMEESEAARRRKGKEKVVEPCQEASSSTSGESHM